MRAWVMPIWASRFCSEMRSSFSKGRLRKTSRLRRSCTSTLRNSYPALAFGPDEGSGILDTFVSLVLCSSGTRGG